MKYLLFTLLIINLFAIDDLKLLKLAYNSGLKPVPANFEALLIALNTNEQELSKEKITLGQKLFFDKNLSLNRDISCASCHSFDKGGADSKSTAIGHKNQENPFHLNTPTVLNTAFSKKYFWNGRSGTLQEQAKGPLQASFEMSITPQLAEQRIGGKEEYKQLFINAYGSSEITFDKIALAISTYEKTLITKGRYDDFLLGDFHALNKKEKEGLELFIKKSCVGCHNGIGLGGQVLRKFPLVYHSVWSMAKPIEIKVLQTKYNNFLTEMNALHFTNDTAKLEYIKSKMGKKDFQLLQKGFFDHIEKNDSLKAIITSSCAHCHEKDTTNIKNNLVQEFAFPFENKGGFLGATEPKKYFRVPLLRNVINTQPYFHNGSIEKLEDTIKIMGIHQSRTNLSDNEIEKIISFLKAVNGEIINY